MTLVTTAPVRPLRPVAEIPAAVYQVGADAGEPTREPAGVRRVAAAMPGPPRARA